MTLSEIQEPTKADKTLQLAEITQTYIAKQRAHYSDEMDQTQFKVFYHIKEELTMNIIPVSLQESHGTSL